MSAVTERGNGWGDEEEVRQIAMRKTNFGKHDAQVATPCFGISQVFKLFTSLSLQKPKS